MARQKITEIQSENNELKERHTSGLQNKMRPLANCSNEKECQNRGNSAKHKGVHQKARNF